MMFANKFHTDESPHLGRYVTSLKAFKQGDILWQESPLIAVPSERLDARPDDKFLYTCVGCFKKITDDEMKCPVCKWPCCSIPCSSTESHKKYECDIFAREEIPFSADTFKDIVFIRFCMYKDLEPEKYEKLRTLCAEYDQMNVYLQKAVKAKELSLMNFLTVTCKLNVSQAEVSDMIPIFQTNNFQIRFSANYFSDFTGQGVFEYSSLFSHCCSPNMEYSFFKVGAGNGNIDWKIEFHARRDIKVGEVLSISYGCGELQFGTAPRQLEILENRHFICQCSRCNDRTEEETYLSALVCSKCPKGYLLPLEPLATNTSPWRCNFCSREESADYVNNLIKDLSIVPLALYDMYTPDQGSLTMADRFIEIQSGGLHKNHYLVFQCALHWLIGSSFPRILLNGTEEADIVFMKIVQRLRRFLPICHKFARTEINANLHFLMAKTLAMYSFQSADMMTIGDCKILPANQIKTCKEILSNLQGSLVWHRMKPNYMNFQREVSCIKEFIAVWSSHLENITSENNNLNQSTLESIPFLFL